MTRHPYATAAYAATLGHVGTALPLDGAGTTLLVRAAPPATTGDPPLLDAVAPYPLMACERWSALDAELAGLASVDGTAGLVSVVGVADPFGADPNLLRRAFPEVARPFKTHHVVDLRHPALADASSDHLRKARRALRSLTVAEEPAAAVADDWCRLYDVLRDRHGITGAADISPEGLRVQLHLDGVRTFVARDLSGAAVGALVWVVHDDVAWYHLGAHDETGYRLGSSFALFAEALGTLRAAGLRWADLGAGAGLVDDPADGLARFKRGWASGVRDAWLFGRVLDPTRYARASRPAGRTTYFPAYRAA